MNMNFKKFAMVGASALVIAMYSGTASAQTAYTFDAGVAETLDIRAEVDNTINADITDPHMGTWGVIRSNAAGEQAVLVLNFDGTQAGSSSGAADAIEGGGLNAAGLVEITGAFPTTPITVTLSAPVDLVCGACAGSSPFLDLYRIEADLLNVVVGTDGTANSVIDQVTPANNAVATATTDGTGALSFNIGARARTTVGSVPYETGSYAGTYDMILEY